MRRVVLAAAMAAISLYQTVGIAIAAPAIPVLPIDGIPVDAPPDVSARSWILFDDTNGVVLGSKDPEAERPMASTTKIMTALVALRRGDPEALVTVSKHAADAGESEIGLVPGEQFPLGLLITTALVRSANDAAMAVAEGVGGDEARFVEMMNAEAADLGLRHTHFVNPHGLDAKGHYTSAADLLTMTRAAMEMPAFADAVRTSQLSFPADPQGNERVAKTTNRLLVDYEGAIGVKTGYTSRAGLVLVAAAERNGRRLYAVVMGSEGADAHFKDATALLDYGFSAFGVVPLVRAGEPYALRRSGTVTDSLSAAATVEALVYLASAGLLMPELSVKDGDASLVVTPDLPHVDLAEPERPALPGLREALVWITRLWQSAGTGS